ncbi:hypothetical protein [Roseibium aggregatum]|uniref:hypothetical protein n=1 Tax=Roseibium aggregatum TaxID=187304 RepID=UPI003A96F48A
MALNTRATHKPNTEKELQDISYALAIVAQRNLAAKLLEYINMLEEYKKRCKRKKDQSMNMFLDEATSAISNLKKVRYYDLALWYRNKVTNHYAVHELTSLIRDGNLGDGDTEHSIYLHEKDGNSYYTLGEQVLLAKLSEDGRDPIETINKFDDWVTGASGKVMKLHHLFCVELLKIYLPTKKAEVCHVAPNPHIVGLPAEACLPIWWDF